jgi:hypothetical protein
VVWRRVGGVAAVVGLCAIADLAWANPASDSSPNAQPVAAVPASTNPRAASSMVRPRENIAKQRDGTLLIAGRSLRCGGARNVLDPRLQNLGLAAPGVVVFNPRELNRWPDTVRLFVFHHECGHHEVGASELGADCWAVKQGVRQGWLDRDGLGQVCRSFGDGPATSTHPAGASRCASLNRCFATAVAALAKEKAAPASQGAPTVEADASGPKLIQGPTLKRSGMRPSLDQK